MLSYLPTNTSFLILAAALACAHAVAAPTDALHVYGGLGYGHDDNLLRVPDGLPGFDNRLGDSWYEADAGLLFEHTYSRQRLSAQARLSKVKFDHFRQLDYDGKDLQANWNWQVGNHLEGKLGATYNQTLAPYTDFPSDQRNLREQRRTFFDGAWRFHPSYRLRAGASKEKFSYELALQSYNDRTEEAWEIGADYLPASGSEIGLVARKLNGKYPNRRPSGQQLRNDDYDQDEFKARVSWIASGSTNVQVLAGWVRRRQPGYGDDTRGFNGRISATWQRHSALSYNAAVWRDFAPIESTIVSHTRNKGASAGAVWEASAKVRLEASAVYERRDYNPRLLALAALGEFNDALRSATVRGTWAPRSSMQLSAALAHQARSGSAALATSRFASNSIRLNASAQF